MIFRGVCTALVTPFDKDGKIDYEKTQKLVEFQLKNGVGTILVLGSTGEGFSVSNEERAKFVGFVKSLLPESAKLIVGAGSNTPAEAIRLINEAKSLGADCCLVQTPYFNKCTQQGLIEHFREICNHVSIPLILYNIPSRSGVNIEPATMEKLCYFPNVCGLKEANCNIDHILEMFKRVGKRLPIYCGNDNLNQVFFSLGASGTISVTSNAYPSEIVEMFAESRRRLAIHDRLFNFNNLMFCEPNPIPIKHALSKKALVDNNLRLPLTKLEKPHQELVDKEMDELEK